MGSPTDLYCPVDRVGGVVHLILSVKRAAHDSLLSIDIDNAIINLRISLQEDIMKYRSYHKWFIVGILLIVAMLGGACAQPPVTETAKETIPSQPTAGSNAVEFPATADITPTATPEADPRNELGSSTWGAVFEEGTETWFQFENDQARSEVRDDKLMLTAKKANGFDAWTMSYPQMKDFYLEVVFTTGEACAGKDRYGILFRAPDPDQGYLFNVACDGSYQLRKWDGEQFTDLINWTLDTHIAKGPEVNQRLGVWAEGDRFVLYINGFEVGEASDSSYSEGTFGVSSAAAETVGFTVDVIEAKAWDLP
jgi:hypothetical protein